MATGDIEHKDLPDELLHEPKGASTASINTVYVADGAGSGSFKLIGKDNINFIKTTITDVATPTIEDLDNVTSTLTKVATGAMADVPADANVSAAHTNQINQNFAELYKLYNTQKEIDSAMKQSLLETIEAINKLIASLKNVGAVNE